MNENLTPVQLSLQNGKLCLAGTPVLDVPAYGDYSNISPSESLSDWIVAHCKEHKLETLQVLCWQFDRFGDYIGKV